ncbi:MAG: MaoC/PaaZ C-terminal domain-containing protein [Spirochaetia bacterium]|nr:MaoC/PaaZ C-terminal domain-containing protein [Spirochaetia bacterium]
MEIMQHELKIWNFDEFEVNKKIGELVIGPITHMDLVRYAGASGDFNPIHVDTDFAISVGLEGTIAHGMYVMAQIGKLITNLFIPMQIKSWGVKFKGMTFPGENIIIQANVIKKTATPEEKLVSIKIEATNRGGNIKASGDLIIACK